MTVKTIAFQKNKQNKTTKIALRRRHKLAINKKKKKNCNNHNPLFLKGQNRSCASLLSLHYSLRLVLCFFPFQVSTPDQKEKMMNGETKEEFRRRHNLWLEAPDEREK
jgi:hypothetical protein